MACHPEEHFQHITVSQKSHRLSAVLALTLWSAVGMRSRELGSGMVAAATHVVACVRPAYAVAKKRAIRGDIFDSDVAPENMGVEAPELSDAPSVLGPRQSRFLLLGRNQPYGLSRDIVISVLARLCFYRAMWHSSRRRHRKPSKGRPRPNPKRLARDVHCGDTARCGCPQTLEAQFVASQVAASASEVQQQVSCHPCGSLP